MIKFFCKIDDFFIDRLTQPIVDYAARFGMNKSKVICVLAFLSLLSAIISYTCIQSERNFFTFSINVIFTLLEFMVAQACCYQNRDRMALSRMFNMFILFFQVTSIVSAAFAVNPLAKIISSVLWTAWWYFGFVAVLSVTGCSSPPLNFKRIKRPKVF